MTSAKAPHLAARTLLLRHLDMHPGKTVENDLDPAEVGVVGDTAHADGGDSYHLGKDQIRARNGKPRYSVDESPRDQAGLDNNASAMDVGWFSVTTQRGTFDLRDFSRWLVALCAAGDPDTWDIREVIYSPDGKVVRRWDRLGRRSSGDNTHLFHSHLSEFRDASGTRMVKLATRWLQHIGLLPEEDNMPMTPADVDVFLKRDVIPNPYGDSKTNPFISVATALKAGPIADVRTKEIAAQVALLRAEVGVVKALAERDDVDEAALVAALAPAVGAYVLANLPQGADQISQDELNVAVETAFQRAFGARG